MAKPQVTITLGRSGQKVIKESWGQSGVGRATASAPPGSKRSLSESLGGGGDNPFGKNKRMREDVNSMSYGHSFNTDGSRLGQKDLRFKLTRKRMSKQIELENENRKKTELHEKVSRTIKSLESPDRNLSRSIPSSYASWTSSNGAKQRSPERILKQSTMRSAIDDELPQIRYVPTMERVPSNDLFDFSRPEVVPMVRRPHDSGKLVPETPPATGGMSRSPYQDNQPLTVSSLLHSLGLGKYSINFQAEEIDMVALKQMGDNDLKELGVPMGPRKKILQALQARMRRPLIQAPRIMSL
ncbi:zinc finger an1 domain-containing stress-associated protein 12 [Phtheirospermum japonicum]|uniref:Zinc finger an1 domain-containing stress-associated protein 12 n=1 Tax=Phtheirospermum japonicum TaxID=374723 RepID=A0A830CSN9_9LAMI|nr:zinc finger an1 domain-containing stress-associated protein 12 [Phtheirospermum japonicum]